MPSLLSLFMNDLAPKVGLKWVAFSDFTLAELNDSQVRILYNVYNDLISNVYFASFFIPEVFVKGDPSQRLTPKITEHIAANYKQMIEDVRLKYSAEIRGAGDSSAESTRNSVFSGRVYVYHVGSLTVSELAHLDEIFRHNGAVPQFRGNEYALAVWGSIRAGDAQAPPKFDIVDNLPQLVNERQ
jgi:hypothetical protein